MKKAIGLIMAVMMAATLKTVVDLLELGESYAEWEAEHAEKYAATQKRRERQADA